ncbi:MAG: hypothetical protein IK004_03300 [Bacteroidales bacterium]|nr:hypothetical protein [Bacteroidales bacterium]
MKEKKGSFFNKYLGGDVFSRQSVVKQLPFVLYVVFLLMLYITNTYIAEDVNREILTKNKILEDRHVEYVYNKSEITRMTKQSELAKILKNKGIKESVEPLKKITVVKETGKNKKK